jgi:catechol 2,3-dioxygenase-like lactoylglutathione lyase family enzyme
VKLARVILRVSDLDRSVRFWTETVGLSLLTRAENFAFLDGEGAQLMLNQADDAATDAMTEFVFEVDDVGTVFEEMRGRGVPFEIELRPVTSDGARDLHAAHFHDPDGHLASLTGWVARV